MIIQSTRSTTSVAEKASGRLRTLLRKTPGISPSELLRGRGKHQSPCRTQTRMSEMPL